ncbi:F-actin-monooxygenase Mical-like isoform X2 [Homarus americanus]|uniref:F-actin-monooxygenase Mical-like isoform X2 n=1 Tax=Homarus americanus TaxID=6706 RepID=UPI001C46290A|nr:F-actin-monooxygenase Mical-like isoform X2 [Homarus americanus]
MYSSHHHHNKQGVPSPESAAAADVFEQLCAANTFKSVLCHYRQLCDVLRLKPTNIRSFYPKLKSKLRSWKAQALWSKFDKRASHKCYNHGKACSNSKVLIIGAGPCGLRSAIECQLLGAKVVVVEKRDRLSRNNVLHLWPFVISDLKQLGAKKFYGKFCAGAIDHISIRQLQCILLKVALLLGVEVFESVSFEELVEPPEDQSEKIGWRARLSPPDHPANQYEFDVLLGADGKRNTLHGFKRKEFRGKLAIAITANFINKRSEAEARVQEISGVAFIFNQKFFKELYAATGIDLENIVYYKDETHYFVMTAKKHSLIDKGVILNDLPDTQQLLHSSNVDRNALLHYAREAADFSTNYQLPHLDFAVNHYGKPDIAMFDFTSMFAAENACRMVERKGHKLLAGLVGDTLLEPFWPTGSGCARGFLSCFDAGWMIRSMCSGKVSSLEVLAERESIYRLLAQTTPENLHKDHSSYTLDPASRYPTINLRVVLPFQVRNLFDTDDAAHLEQVTNPHLVNSEDLPKKRKRRDSFIHPDTLLVWCKKQVALYDSIHVEDMTTSFKDGRALCAIIHRYRPDLIDFEAVRPQDIAQNNQLAFDILERDFGIPPVMTGAEMAECEVPDKLSMISYLSQIYDVFRGEIPHFKHPKMDDGEMEVEQSCAPTQRSTPHVNILKNLTNKTASTSQGTPSSKKRMSLERGIGKRDDGRITCRLIDDAGISAADRKMDSLKRTKKRRSDRVTSPQDDIESRQRREEILSNRLEQLKKQKERRELDNVRFIRSMQMLQCGITDSSSIQQSYNRDEDYGITEYRKNCVRTMREKAEDLERKLNHRPGRPTTEDFLRKAQVEQSGDFNDKVKDLEAKFTANSNTHVTDKKPKDLLRAIGKIERSDWNMVAIEKKMHENKFGVEVQAEKEKVPKWSRDAYDDKFHNIERRLRENGENEETIAKYRDIDSSLKRLEMKLREGSTLETGMRGQNKVSNLASQLSSKLEKKEPEKVLITRQPSRPTVPLPTSGSDLCHFCGNRVYLVERLSAEGKFFHRQCFKCDYCAANLRLGNYIYDREGRYGGKFFCIPHFGLTPRIRALRRRAEDTDSAKENIVPPAATSTPKLQVPVVGAGEATGALASSLGIGKGGTSTGLSPEDRGTTPERVEFENSVVEQSDEDEYLSEDEWTDRNFGASANELDDSDGEDDSDYSDLSDEEVNDEELEFPDGRGTLTAAETRKLVESWHRRYSTDRLDDDYEDEGGSGHESESDLDSDNYSEEYGAEGDESHTATEGEGGEDDDDEDEGEAVRRARELRRMEVNIDVAAPPRKAETSDSGSETEVASDEESEESDTQIDTDSEFAEDHVQPGPPKEIPTIIINESQDTHQDINPSPSAYKTKESHGQSGVTQVKGEPRTELVSQKVDLEIVEKKESGDWGKENGEKSASLTNLNETGKTNPRAEQLKRLLQRTDSTEAIAAQRALQLKRQYLLGETVNLPRKSVSTADLGNRFKSFMDKISETQKMLNPAPQPSAAMQAFMSSSVPSPRSPASSPSSPLLPARSISLPQGDNTSDSTNTDKADMNISQTKLSVATDVSLTESSVATTCQKAKQDITTQIESSVYPVEAIDKSEVQVKVPDQLKGFPVSGESSKINEAIDNPEENLVGIPVSESSSESSSDVSSEDGSDYDNVPSGCKWPVPKKSPTTIEIQKQASSSVIDNAVCDNDVTSSTGKDIVNEVGIIGINRAISGGINSNKEEEVCKSDEREADKKEENVASDEEGIDEFGLSVLGENEGLETVNRELVLVNEPHSREPEIIKCQSILKEEIETICVADDKETEKHNEIEDNVDELFNILASDAVEDTDKFSEFIESPGTNTNGFSHSDNKSRNSDTLTSQILTVCDNEEEKPSVEETVSEPIEPIVEIIVENPEKIQEKLPLERTISISDETKPLVSKEVLSSPEEGRENTEPELSDWAGENDGISAGEDLEVEFNEPNRQSVKKDSSKIIARIASVESLGDTDSAISTGPNITTSVPSKPCALADLEGIEFMDTSESASSPDDVSHKKQGYRKLEEETPTTPIAPQISLIDIESVKVQDQSSSESKSSESTSTEMDDNSQSSVQEALNNNMAEHDNKEVKDPDIKFKMSMSHISKSMSESHLPKSTSEPPSLSEIRPKVNGEHRRDSLDDYTSPKRYEGYIPRFKERMSPFGYVRDSIDIQKNSTKSPLFTPSKKEVEERQKNEQRLAQCTVQNSTVASKPAVSPNTAKRQIVKSLRSSKEKEKDLIKELVMSRISWKNSEKSPRRGSRTSVSPLSSTGSRTSLFSPQSSQENLLEKEESDPGLEKKDLQDKKIIHIDTRELLRLESIKPDLPESGQTFAAEENRSKVRVGTIFREDSVLGFSNKRESLQDLIVPFADESLDEEVYERKEDKNPIKYIPKQFPGDVIVKPVTNTEPTSPVRINLPATPMTHPEQFNRTPPKKEVFKVPSVPAPITPLRRHHTPGSSGMSTPINSDRPLSTPNLSTIERERAREEARIRARLKTDLDFGLSPPNLADNLREKLKKGSLSESEGDKEEKGRELPTLVRQTAVLTQGREESAPKNKDERVKELLAEQRQHRHRDSSDGQQEEWNNKDDRVKERLEEYRQRRRGSTRSSESGDSRPNSQLLRRHTHRPSLLELESLQVFSTSPSKAASVVPTSVGITATIASTSASPVICSSPSVQHSNVLPLSPATSAATVSSSTTPPSHPLQDSASSEKITDKKSGKKSKDRERRRSLIQVFAGMFSKSGGDDKKKSEQQPQPSDTTEGVSACKTIPPTIQPLSTAPIETPKSAPKSPSTVRDKLSKLRLSRSKEKKKIDKGRSNSADILDDRGNTDNTRAAFSLPTSPSRRPIPFLSSPFTKASSPPQASGSTYSSSQVRLNTPRIEEESLSDDEGGVAGTPVGTLERSFHGPWSGSTNRKQRTAVFKAARQAELKRLRMAQEIQRQLEECEVKTRELEERGVAVEKALRGESDGANRDEADLMGDWFSMVHEKNALVRWEQELMVQAKELELEDRHVRLEHELRHRMALSEHEKSRDDIDREGTILAEMLSILEQKDALVTMLEEDRQRYMEEDRDLESVMLRKGLHLSPLRRETGV